MYSGYFSTPKWKVKNNPVFRISLGYYITKRINTGIGLAASSWRVQYNTGGIKNSHDEAVSAYIFGNYNLPVRSSIFYGGGYVGLARSYDISGRGGNLHERNGHEINLHVGYNLTLVKNRFWFNVETGYTSTTIIHEFSHHTISGTEVFERRHYSVTNYPVLVGLKFRL